MADASSLTNHLLIAMPSLADPNFAHTVTLVCEHSVDKGALGIIINKPLPMTLSEVLSQMKLEAGDPAIAARTVLRGGPVHKDRGFVVHRPGGTWDSSHAVSDAVQVTTSRDVLAAMAASVDRGGLADEQAITAAEALAMYTTGGAAARRCGFKFQDGACHGRLPPVETLPAGFQREIAVVQQREALAIGDPRRRPAGMRLAPAPIAEQ